MNKAWIPAMSLIGGIVLTAIGAFNADGALGVLLTPGRTFNRTSGFGDGPREQGVLYGLAANCVVIAALLWVTLFSIGQLVRKRRL